MKRYFLLHEGASVGPLSLSELTSKNIRKDTLVRYEGMADWVPASTIPELRSFFQGEGVLPPSGPKQHVKRSAYTGVSMLIAFLIIALTASLIGNFIQWKQLRRQATLNRDNEKQLRIRSVVGQMERDIALDSMQKKKKLLDQKYKEIRNHWKQYIKAAPNDYGTGLFGGIQGLRITIANNTPRLIEKVGLRVVYIKENGEVWDKITVIADDIPPHSKKAVSLPDSNRGTSVEVSIVSVKSSGLSLCYPNGGKGGDDPYYCIQ